MGARGDGRDRTSLRVRENSAVLAHAQVCQLDVGQRFDDDVGVRQLALIHTRVGHGESLRTRGLAGRHASGGIFYHQ